jgi:hypothetical protein
MTDFKVEIFSNISDAIKSVQTILNKKVDIVLSLSLLRMMMKWL